MNRREILNAALLACSTSVQAAEPMAYFYNAPESAKDRRYQFYRELLKEALERTVASYGAYVLRPSPAMNEVRQFAELQADSSKITVVVRGGIRDYTKFARYVPIPLDNGLLGYRVLLIRRQNQARFSAVRSLEDLRPFTVGQGTGWKDVDILRANGLNVVTGSNYEGLFEMLKGGRFDCFSRGVEEIVDEFDTRKVESPELAIEKDLLLHYPLARYAWFSNSDKGRALAGRMQVGLQSMVDSGDLERMFQQYLQVSLETLQLPQRRLIELTNPFAIPDDRRSDGVAPFNRRIKHV